MQKLLTYARLHRSREEFFRSQMNINRSVNKLEVNKMKRLLFFFIAMLAAVVLLTGCSADSPADDESPAESFSEVYNDGVTIIDAGRLIRLPGSNESTEYCCLELRLTNNGTAPIYYSSLLCISISSNSSILSNDNVLDATRVARDSIESFNTLDGVIDPDTTVEGFAIFEAPVGADLFDISLATDFCRDSWVSFTCGVK